MDWNAVSAVATGIAALIAYLVYRKSHGSVNTPQIDYNITSAMVRKDESSPKFCINHLVVRNSQKFDLEGISLELRAQDPQSVTIVVDGVQPISALRYEMAKDMTLLHFDRFISDSVIHVWISCDYFSVYDPKVLNGIVKLRRRRAIDG